MTSITFARPTHTTGFVALLRRWWALRPQRRAAAQHAAHARDAAHAWRSAATDHPTACWRTSFGV